MTKMVAPVEDPNEVAERVRMETDDNFNRVQARLDRLTKAATQAMEYLRSISPALLNQTDMRVIDAVESADDVLSAALRT